MPDTWDSLTQYEQNALVATDAMGWHESRGPSGEPEWRYKSVARACSVKDYRPTKNIEQAWEVLEHIADRDLNDHAAALGLARVVLNKYPTGEWSCRITRDIAAVARASNVCDAICHAAVLAVGGMNDA